jgi:hypothetical protein
MFEHSRVFEAICLGQQKSRLHSRLAVALILPITTELQAQLSEELEAATNDLDNTLYESLRPVRRW